MGGGGGSQSTTTSSQTSQAGGYGNEAYQQYPSYALPYAQEGIRRSNRLANMPYTPYPYYSADPYAENPNFTNALTGESVSWDQAKAGLPFQSTAAPLNAQQQQSMGNIADYANNLNNPLINAAMGGMTDTLSGQYLNPQSNPYLAEYANQAMGDVTRNYQNAVVPQLNASASRAGAFGGSSHELLKGEAMRNLGDTLSKTATGIYNPAYQQERNLMVGSQSMAPGTAQMPVTQQMAGLGVGDVYQQQEQANINSLLGQQQQAVQWPFMTSQAAAQQFPIYGWGSQSGGTGTNWQTSAGSNTATMPTQSSNPFSSIFGGAAQGAGTGLLASMAGANPYTAAGIGGLSFMSSLFK